MISLASSLQDVQSFDEHLLFYLCCTFGSVVGALAGASASSRVRMDMFGIVACGTVASLGGGTVRDLLLSGMTRPNGDPVTVFWMSGVDVDFFYQAIFTSLFVFFVTRFVKPPVGTIRVADAFAMAFFTLLGTAKAFWIGCDPAICIAMGVCTGVAGGILRDVLTGYVPYVFRPGEIYATASFTGSALFVLLMYFELPYAFCYILCTIVVFAVRMAAVYHNWKLPSYRPLIDNVSHSDDDKHDDK